MRSLLACSPLPVEPRHRQAFDWRRSAAVPGGLSQVEPAVFSFLLGQLDREQPAAARTTAADVLARARLTATQLDSLADALKIAGPLEVDRLLTAFEQSTDEALGLKLVKSLGESSALPSLRIDAIKQHLAKFGAPVQTAAQGLYAPAQRRRRQAEGTD